MSAAVAVKDFVTVVSVDGSCSDAGSVQQVQQQQQQQTLEDSFVTVLAIGEDSVPAVDVDAAAAEEVLVYRLPGERLGFGLRFDGVDTCNRLFVQSCADGSPASRTQASWGPLSAGDEIVRINGRPVNKLSRDDCVRCLKESGLVVKLHMVDGRMTVKAPPPVPPRKQKKPEPPPPIASSAVYTDAVERFVYHGESESDDTNSSVSTVVSKCPAATPCDGGDDYGGDSNNSVNNNTVLDRVLEPFMQLEREFSSSAAIGDDMGLYEKLVAVAEEDRGLPPKPLPRKEVRPPKKKPPPPPPPLPSPLALPPPPPYRLPPRLVDFVHKDDPAQTTVHDDGDGNDNVFANDGSISGPSGDDNVIAEQDDCTANEDNRQVCETAAEQPEDLKTPERSRVGCGGEQAAVMKSSYSVAAVQPAELGRTDSETDSDGSRRNTATAKRPSLSGRTDKVCNQSVRDKIAMFSRATAAGGVEKKDSAPSSACTTATGSPADSPPAASPRAATYQYCSSTLPRNQPPPPYQQLQWPQRGGTPTAVAGVTVSRSSPPPPEQAAEHRRSLSLVEQPYSKYFNTMNAYAEMGRSSLNALIEQRRRSMSKLRGLVIPEKAPLGDGCRTDCGADDAQLRAHPAAIPDLPLVIGNSPRPDADDASAAAVLCPPTKTYVNGPPPVTGTVTRHASPVKTAVARQMLYVSPAVQLEQRRPLPAVQSLQEQRRPSSASSSPSSSSSSSSSSLNSSREELRHIHDERPPSSTKSKSSFKADSDEDSALSSSRSSTSLQQYSPASSPPPPPPPATLPPPINIVDAAVPCSEVGKRVLKAESVEAINRKNVLCSARISSGKPEPSLFGGNDVAQTTADRYHHQPQQQQQLYVSGGAPAKTTKTATAAFAIGTTAGGAGNRYSHIRMSSVESTTSEESSMQYAVNAEPFGSISSIASSTSLISQQELQQLIDDANQTLEENGCSGVTPASSVPMSFEVMVIILHRDMATSSVGITLAGGADYETKEITVYKVLTGSPADKDGRIRKGDRILSINGKSMKGITHRESLAILKAPRSEVVLVISRCKSDATVAESAHLQSREPVISAENDTMPNRVFGQLTKVTLSKDGSGLGFSLEGGKNSPTGDQPLIVKKIFTGGCAEQCGQILAGDELVSVNDIDVTGMSRTEAWNLMKRLVNGTVTLGIRHAV